jgi:hypothetical protein
MFREPGLLARRHRDTNESNPIYSLAGQLTGMPLKPLQGGVPAESYGFANKRLAWETIAPLLVPPQVLSSFGGFPMG